MQYAQATHPFIYFLFWYNFKAWRPTYNFIMDEKCMDELFVHIACHHPCLVYCLHIVPIHFCAVPSLHLHTFHEVYLYN